MRSPSHIHVRVSAVFGLAALLTFGPSCGTGNRSQAAPAAKLATRAARLTIGAGGTGTCASNPATACTTSAQCSAGDTCNSTVSLTAQRMTTALRDGTLAPMWGYCVTGAASCSVTPATATSPAILPTWAPGPTIVVPAGNSLTISLTNALPVPTSLVVPGQFGGGLGAPTTMPSPAHAGQNFTTFPGNGSATPPFTPPAQGPRVRSFGAEVAAGEVKTLSWTNLQPGTYLYETGTMPSLQAPMGMYGVLVVTTPPAGTCSVTTATTCSTSAECPSGETCNTSTPGTAYPGVSYDDDAALLFSEMDPVQNAAVDAAASAVPTTDVNLRFNDPSCTPHCYPAAVNYTPTYFFINGHSFDRTAPQDTAFLVADSATYSAKQILVRLLNAGSRTHIPSIVGLPMALVAEDGNLAPGNPKIQNEALLTAGKTYDVVVKPPPTAAGTTYAPGTYPVFDRALSLSTANHPDGGMQGFLLVDHAAAPTSTTGTCSVSGATCAQATASTDCGGAGGACILTPVAGAPGNLPAGITPQAVADSFNVPYNPGPPVTYAAFTGNVTANDTGIARVALVSGVSNGTLSLAADGSFTYTPNAGFKADDQFTYSGNGDAALTAKVTLSVASQGIGPAPVAGNDAYTSALATKLHVARPGVLSNDRDPSGYPLFAGSASAGSCGSVVLDPDGSFDVTAVQGQASCQFTYQATNSQGTSSNTATVAVTFVPTGYVIGPTVAVLDASSGTALSDYRWTLQEDLTFKHQVGSTPSVNTRTVGTSFHRSNMPIVATGCVGPVSCGSGQSVRGVVTTDQQALARATTPDQVALDPTRSYYISILPGDGSPPGHAMGGGQLVLASSGTAWTPMSIKLQATPLQPAQLSIYIYEDNNPTNGQDDISETGLGGFNIILFDPAGRTGDPAGQQSYDAFNMPLSNALLGSPGCPDEQNTQTNGTATSPGGNLVGAVYTCPNAPPGFNDTTGVYALAGHALIKNLTPARYDVIAHPGAAREGAGEVWWQTETLEGTPAQDAFVGVAEPVYFQEFGPPGPHTTIGFVNPNHLASNLVVATGGATVTGKITNQHMSRPSDVTLWDSGSYALLSSTTCRVVLNSQSGTGPAIAAAECDPDGNFTLSGIPPGSYDLAVFDQWLDQIIQNTAVNVPPAATAVALGDIPVLSWFTQYDQNIYQDLNGNGVYDDGEPGISNVPLSVRFRNGAPSNVTLSDSNGNGILVELFPLFNWYVAEADTTRFKQTGVHVWVDGGGKPDTTGPGASIWTSTYATGQPTERLEQPGQLSYGFQGFISQRNRVDWGRTPYVKGENGGIVGTVVYSSTRPFDDMRFNVQTIWEPLVPRVTVNLYAKTTLADGTETLSLVDSTQTSSWDDFVNLVYGADQNQYYLGSDNRLRVPATGALAPASAYPPGKQVNLQCPGQLPTDPFVNYTLGASDAQRCYDGWHSWNQVQAAPYDGRYVFPSAAYVAAHPLCSATVTTNCTPPAAGQTLVSLPPGTYVVETVTPPGYEVVKEEDKNILIGDTFVAPATQQFGPLGSIFILPDQATLNNANPFDPGTGDAGFQSDPTNNLGVYGISSATIFPECVGSLHRVPDYLSLYPQAQQVAPFAGMDRPLCDRKKVVLNDAMQSSANFFVFTEVPAAGNATGIILDDATAEFNALAPDFGEKASVPFVPVSVKDFTGLEIGRTYSDQWGAYNMLTPSSWLVNPPTPSGYGPDMLITCINDPGPIPDPKTGKLITDPAYNPAYSNFCYTNPYMPGQATYLDTPVLPVAAFAAGYNPPDCAYPSTADTTDPFPAIARVDSSFGIGPYLPGPAGTLTITALGDQMVPNPAYGGPFATSGLAAAQTVLRHYGFGTAKGTVRLNGLAVPGANVTWSDGTIQVNVPPTATTGELSITTATGRTSVDTVTVTIGGKAPTLVQASLGQKIQDAIDLATPGDLVMIDAGTYDELVIMWKPVRLQGVGAASVIINAAKYPNSKLADWRPRINQLFNVDVTTGNLLGPAQVDPLPTQEITGGVVLLEPTVLGTEEGAGITVLAKNLPQSACGTIQMGSESNFLCASSAHRRNQHHGR